MPEISANDVLRIKRVRRAIKLAVVRYWPDRENNSSKGSGWEHPPALQNHVYYPTRDVGGTG
jgi:hypothetical protein